MLHRKSPQAQDWLTRAIATAKFHTEKCKSNPAWLLNDTSESLNRSLGSVCQDLLIVSWLKTHEDQIRKFKTMRDALEFIRVKKQQVRLDVSHVD